MQQQNIQSTKITSDLSLEASLDVSPSLNQGTHVVFATMLSATRLKNRTPTKLVNFLPSPLGATRT